MRGGLAAAQQFDQAGRGLSGMFKNLIRAGGEG
jgi:hypothetical protein